MKRTIKIATLLLLILSCLQYTIAMALPGDVEAQNKLTQISEEEKTIIEELFVLSSEIELLNTKIIKLSQDIQAIESKITLKETEIGSTESHYETLKTSLAKVLRIQQRSGVASNVEILLKSKNLKDLLSRINLLRDLSKNVDDLMTATEGVRLKLEREKETFETLLTDMENQETLLAQTISDKSEAKSELETYLSNLSTEKEHYEAYLKSIENQWNSLKPLFAETIASFTEIIEKGDLPEDTVEVHMGLFNTRGTIREDKFNNLLSKKTDLPELTFDFKADRVNLSFPSYEVELEGRFELVDNQTIQYVVTGGQFYGLPMSASALEDLFSDGDLVFNLKAILGKNTIKKIENYEDRLELQITISLF